MAMTLPIALPVKQATPSDDSPSPTSNSNSNSTAIPRTPISPTMPQQQQQQSPAQSPSQTQAQAQAQMKRKPSRRANTAERRATHNAVERQRRETLNGRFLDLAALLPNLSQIRRPSKSSIVNSSIAHIHASRRHRLLAARELRLLKLEADALRRELNEWRDRAGIPRVEEPVRGDGFGIIIAGELEVIVGVGAGTGADDDEDDPDDDMGLPNHGGMPQYGGYVGGDGVDEDFGIDAIDSAVAAGGTQNMMDDPRVVAMLKNHSNHFAHSAVPLPQQQQVAISTANSAGLPHILPRTGGNQMPPVFDGMYDGHHPNNGYSQAQYLHDQQQQHAHQQRELQHHHEQEKLAQAAAWGLFPNARPGPQQQAQQQPTSFLQGPQQQHHQQQMIHSQRSLYTPPSTSHGLPSPPSTSSVGAAHGSPSPGSSKRERSGSIASGYGSSPPIQHQHGSLSPSYELGLPAAVQGEYGVAMPRMVNVNVTGAQGMGMGGMGLVSPVSAGGAGGGGGGGFAMMMY